MQGTLHCVVIDFRSSQQAVRLGHDKALFVKVAGLRLQGPHFESLNCFESAWRFQVLLCLKIGKSIFRALLKRSGKRRFYSWIK